MRQYQPVVFGLTIDEARALVVRSGFLFVLTFTATYVVAFVLS